MILHVSKEPSFIEQFRGCVYYTRVPRLFDKRLAGFDQPLNLANGRDHIGFDPLGTGAQPLSVVCQLFSKLGPEVQIGGGGKRLA
jgi:hypothetical protein